MTDLTVPASTVTVLDAPLTRELAAAALNDAGEVTATVSLDWPTFVRTGDQHDAVLDLLAEAVLSDLSGSWTLTDYVPVGLDPRSTPDSQALLVTVSIAPNYEDS